MSVDPSFWQSKQAQARYQIEKKSAMLDELMEREQVLIDQLFAAKPGSVLAEAAPAAAEPNLQLELDEARAALAAADQQREIDVQKTAAYWLEEIRSLRGKLGAEAAPAAAEPNLQLELDEARAALAAADQQREIDVQKTAAYWLEEIRSLRRKLGAAEASAAAAASATEAAAAVAWQQGVEAAAAEAARAEPLPSLTFQRVEGLVAGAAIAVATGVASDEASEGGGDAELRQQHQEELEAAALLAERQLQATGLFWVERARALETRAKASEARAAALEEALHARELRAEIELQRSAAFWVKRVAGLEATLAATGEAAAAAAAAGGAGAGGAGVGAGVPPADLVAEAVAVLAAEAERAKAQASE